MKRFFVIGVLAVLGACATGGGSGPTRAPKNARTSMWSSRPAADLADCISQHFGITKIAQDDGYTFTLPGVGGDATYRIEPVTEPSAYASQVNAFGSLLPGDEEAGVSTCLLPPVLASTPAAVVSANAHAGQ